MIDQLGAIPLSPDILEEANIGLWAFELDEGSEPRMYADNAMLKLLGLKEQIPPEEIYHAWYDNIDDGSYDLVSWAVSKMANGEHAEVQYPWHHPDGRTWIVRCGGVRNPEYTKGTRIEGTHQNVTELLHFDEGEMERLRQTEEKLRHEKLRSDVFKYMLDHGDEDPIELLKIYAEQIRVLIDCDQVIYRDLEETRIMVNSPAIEKTWSVPFEYCQQCEHLDAHHPMYAGGYTEMDNCQEGWQGIPVYEKCPIKSSLTRLVYCDNEIAGYLAIHYVQDYHHFTDIERETVEEFTRILSLSLSRYTAKQNYAQLETEKAYEVINAFTEEYSTVYLVNAKDDSYSIIKTRDEYIDRYGKIDRFGEAMKAYIEDYVLEQDKEQMLRELNLETVLKRLQESPRYNIEYRAISGGTSKFHEVTITRTKDEDQLLIGFSVNDYGILERKLHAKSDEDYFALYECDFDTGLIKLLKKSPWYSNIEIGQTAPYKESMLEFASVFEGETRAFFEQLSDIEQIKLEFATDDKFTYSYKSTNIESGRWVHVSSYVIQRHEDGTPAVFTMGFSLMDTFGSDQQELQGQIAHQKVLLDYFIKSYDSAYFVDLMADSFEILHMNDDLYRVFEMQGDKSAMDEFIDFHVHPDDKEMMYQYSDKEYVINRLKTEDSFSFIVREIFGDTTRTMRGLVVRGIDEYHIAVGFMDISEDVRKEREQMNLIEESSHIIGALSADFGCVNYIELSENKADDITVNYRTSELLKKLIPGWEEEPSFTKKLDLLINNVVYEPDKEQFYKDSRREVVQKMLADSDTYVINMRTYFYDEIKYYQVQFSAIREDDKLVGIVAGLRSVDEQMKKELEAQDQLQEALAMAQSANRAKTTFLNNMSHDIRTPMNAIIGYTGLAASHIDNKEQVQDYLSKIAQSSEHLLSLINDVLDMSRIESGKMNLDEKEENLSAIIHTLSDIVQADIHSKQLDFFIDTLNVTNEDVICDKLRLNQILLNIVSNAIKYTAAGGTVSMRIVEKAVKPNGYATYEFRVKDNGMGMSEEFLETIFDPFTRVKSSTVSGIQGTGLGMSITKNIIDMMGGEIDIQSKVGAGTEVVVTLDLRLANAPVENYEIPELEGLRGLVVDDDSNTCLSITKMLEDIGMRSDWCTSGKEAVIRAKDAHQRGDGFKVYIIDWLMPDMNGIETTRRIRKVIGDEVPIIILTAYDWTDIEDEAREAGVTAFVSKPMFMSDLHRVLGKCIGTLADEPAEVEEFDFTNKKVLLVEDNELNREIATELLKEHGFAVTEAEDGDIAVEMMSKASAGDYDLVLMDIQMPTMDGYEATREIRALNTEISKIPIIAMTANAFEEDRRAALDAGMNEHIAKPIDIEILLETLAKFL